MDSFHRTEIPYYTKRRAELQKLYLNYTDAVGKKIAQMGKKDNARKFDAEHDVRPRHIDASTDIHNKHPYIHSDDNTHTHTHTHTHKRSTHMRSCCSIPDIIFCVSLIDHIRFIFDLPRFFLGKSGKECVHTRKKYYSHCIERLHVFLPEDDDARFPQYCQG